MRLFRCILLGSLVGIHAAEAQQEVVAPLPTSINAILQQAGIPQIPAASDPSSISSLLPSDSPFQWPPFVLRPHYLYRFLYGNGVQTKPGVPSTTAIDTFSPGFLLEIGSHWTVDYTPTWDLYSNHAFRDTLGQAVVVAATNTYEGWTSQFTQSYNYSSQPLIETAVQTSVQDYNTAVDLSHSLSQHVLFETTIDQDLRYAVGFPDSYNWSGVDWLHYKFSQQLDTAIGAELGYVHESQGSDSEYASPKAQFSWQPAEKITFRASGGWEYREFLGHPRTNLDTPTYDASITYAPFERTKLILDAARSLSAAYAADQTTKTSVITASLQQRLLKILFLTGSIVHTDADYVSTLGSIEAARSDNRLSYNAKLSTAFLRRGTVSLIYIESHNSSTLQGYGFTSRQIGMQIDYRY